MKKLLICLSAVLLLAGCGSKEASKTEKTYKKEVDGVKMVVKATAEGKKEKLTGLQMTVEMPYNGIGMTKDTIDEKMEKELSSAIANSILSSLHASTDDVSVETELKDNSLSIKMEFKEDSVKKAVLNKEDGSLKDLADMLAEQGFNEEK